MKEKDIHELFLNGDKTIYQIFQEKKKQNPDASYPPVYHMIKRLSEEGALIEVEKRGKNPRKAKWFTITTTGLAKLYFLRREDRKDLEDLKFHHSKDAKEIIDKIYQEVEAIIKKMYNVSFYNDGRGKLFKEALSVSPSLIEFFENEKIAVRIIKDPELFSYVFKNYPGASGFCFDVIPDENLFLCKRFLGEMLPIECVARDYEKYHDDRIKVLLGKYLLFSSRKKWERKKEQETLNKKIGKIKKSCTDNWILYIPPVGEPVLACKGCPEYTKK